MQAEGQEAAVNGYSANKDDYLKRLRRVEGQVRGLQRMVEEDKYCIDILTQVSAATKALQSVAIGLLEEHIGHCVVEGAGVGGREADLKVKEASEAIARLVRSEAGAHRPRHRHGHEFSRHQSESERPES